VQPPSSTQTLSPPPNCKQIRGMNRKERRAERARQRRSK
jgi:hypothetical protein